MVIQTNEIQLRPTQSTDLDTLFAFQLDQEGGYLAAFMPKDYDNREAYIQKHLRFLDDLSVHGQTIWLNETIVGSIAKFILHGNAEITYWIERRFWGQGIATKALQIFLTLENSRPLYARVACDNYGSQQVLEKNGFQRKGSDRGFASARQMEIEEFIYRIDSCRI
jgi:ribosomal-protein-alanine N-acetyltransferase